MAPAPTGRSAAQPSPSFNAFQGVISAVSPVRAYEVEFRRADGGGRDLVVMFSSGRRFAFYRQDLGCDVLFVADRDLRYYLRDAASLAKTVIRTVEQGDYQRVLFAGSSKGGFGALSISRLCARLRPGRVFHVVAFSPQVRLFPRNPELYFNSYAMLMRRALVKPRLMRALRRFGDVSDVGREPNLVVEIIYAGDAAVDRNEARRISGANVSHRVVAGATHGTAFHFMCHGLEKRQIRARIKQAYRRSGDQDLRQTRPADLRVMVDEVVASTLKEPTITGLFAEILARGPAAPRASAPKLAARIAAILTAAIQKTLRPAIGKS